MADFISLLGVSHYFRIDLQFAESYDDGRSWNGSSETSKLASVDDTPVRPGLATVQYSDAKDFLALFGRYDFNSGGCWN